MKRTVYLFRHTQSTDNKYGLFSGDRKNTELSEEGMAQALVLQNQLHDAEIDIAISSPLKRSIQTMHIVLNDHHKPKLIIDDRIRERDYGILEGRNKQKLMTPILRYWAHVSYRSYLIPPPGGENFKQVWKRVTPFVNDVLKMIKEQEANVAICAHNNSMRPIRSYFEHKTPQEMLKENSDLGKVFEYEIEV